MQRALPSVLGKVLGVCSTWPQLWTAVSKWGLSCPWTNPSRSELRVDTHSQPQTVLPPSSGTQTALGQDAQPFPRESKAMETCPSGKVVDKALPYGKGSWQVWDGHLRWHGDLSSV